MKKYFSNANSLIINLFFFSIITYAITNDRVKGKIVCFGDSITYGYSFEGNGWPEQLAKMSIKINVINAGRSGRKTSDKDELVPVIEQNTDANYFIILLGVNDLKDGNDSLVNVCYNNMKWMIETVQKGIPTVKILLLSPCGINLKQMSEKNQNKKYNSNTAESLIKLEKKYHELASLESVEFASLLYTISAENIIDGIHPNLEGYAQIKTKIWNELKRISK